MSRLRAQEKIRADIYAFLASLFLTVPTEEQVERLRGMLGIFQLPPLKSLALEEVKREFYDLFVVPNPKYVRPYESVYRDKIRMESAGNQEPGRPPTKKFIRGLLMGKSARGVIQHYRSAGMYPVTELPDHIGNELSFLSSLALKKGSVSQDESERLGKIEKDFKKKHIMKWIGKLEKKVSRNDSTGYYQAAVATAQCLLLEQ